MKIFREISLGFLTAIASSLVILGAIIVSLTEGLSLVVPTPEPTLTLPVLEETTLASIPTSANPSLTPTPGLVIVTRVPTFTSDCTTPTPDGWVTYTTSQGNLSLSAIAASGVDLKTLMDVNCLSGPGLVPDSKLSVPPLPSPTPTPSLTLTPSQTSTKTRTRTVAPSPTTCVVHPAGWVRYTIKTGDTLSSLAILVGTTVQNIMRFNCLPDVNIRAGGSIYLPRLPGGTPTVTPRASATRTPVPTRTRTVVATIKPTGTNIATLTSTLTGTATFTPTHTFSPTHTFTPTFTFTPSFTFTFTPTFTRTNTAISIVTATNPPPTPGP